ncbi:MAG: rhomboid family intramembrane serine protease, partial [Thermoanaerobaculaceae bacterium]|nr:rhomboid family intramembrane serine protease [Thermoanaerobaculaceae bacterium]
QRLREAVERHPFKRWGLTPAHPTAMAFLTSMFIHGGWMHLLGNMLILWLAGPFVEDAFGRPLFTALYLISGVFAAGSHVLAFPDSQMPLGGASGAIAGVMGAFLIRYAFVKIRFFYWFGLIFRGTFDAPAWIMLPLWLLQNLFFASLDTEGRGGVAYWAHVGGFAFGAAVAFAIKSMRVEEKYIAPRIEAQISVSQHPALDAGMDLMHHGDFPGARGRLAEVLATEPRNPDANLAMWQCFVAEGNASSGSEYVVRVIEDALKRDEPGVALQHWRELVDDAGMGGPGPLRWRLAAALEGADPGGAIVVLQQLAGDGSAGLLAEKAARKLEAMGAKPVAPVAPEVVPVAEEPLAPRPLPPPPVFDVAQRVPAPPARALAVDTPFLGTPYEIEESGLISVQEDGLVLHAGAGGTELLPYVVLRGMAVAGITEQPRPFLILDLLLKPEPGLPVKVLRLRSSEFDPRRILNRPDLNSMVAFRELVGGIARLSGVAVWPANLLAEGSRFTTFPSLDDYELQVLTPLCE